MDNHTWNWLGDEQRTRLLVACGWVNGKGALTPTGKRIYKTNWFDLSEAAKAIIARKLAEMPA